MKTALFSILIILFGFSVSGQETLNDEPSGYVPRSIGPWSEKQVSFRVGLGVRKSFYTDLGIAFHKCNYSDVGFFSRDIYTALEWIPSRNEHIFGLKVGIQANAYLLDVGLEAKYQTNFIKSDFVITPKIGFGLFGDLNVFYGYNISTNKKPFSQIGSHQFSLVFNLNNHFLRY